MIYVVQNTHSSRVYCYETKFDLGDSAEFKRVLDVLVRFRLGSLANFSSYWVNGTFDTFATKHTAPHFPTNVGADNTFGIKLSSECAASDICARSPGRGLSDRVEALVQDLGVLASKELMTCWTLIALDNIRDLGLARPPENHDLKRACDIVMTCLRRRQLLGASP